MRDCTYFLYKALLKYFPYVPSEEMEQNAEKLEQVKAHLERIPEPYQFEMIDLIDCIEGYANDRGRYAFQLGLDAGLSIAREGQQLQDEW